jgi:general L-amino acid transport system permease protein
MAARVFQSIAARPAPVRTGGLMGWLRGNLFADVRTTVSTLIIGGLLLWYLPQLFNWAVWTAYWLPDAQACHPVEVGACWGVVAEKYRLIIFGRYPFEEQWRPLVATVLMMTLLVVSCVRLFWKPWLAGLWVLGLGLFFWLMLGGMGLSRVETDRWGGLPLTLLLATLSIAMAFPLALLVALGRRSELPAIRTLCTLYVELIRGVPLISVLFMASFMFPLFMPQGTKIDVLIRVLAGITLFAAAYMAEVIRGGLQAIPKGQDRAAAGAGHGGAGHHEQLHCHLQGHLAGDHRQPLRAYRRARPGAQFRRRLAALQDRGLCLYCADLFCVLLCHVALQPLGRARGQQRSAALIVLNRFSHEHSHHQL